MVNGKWENICSRADTCALTGAAAFFSGIPKSEVLVNGPLYFITANLLLAAVLYKAR